MKKKLFTTLTIICLLIVVLCCITVFILPDNAQSNKLNSSDINDVTETVKENINDFDRIKSVAQKYDYVVCVFDKEKSLLYKTDDSGADTLLKAAESYDTIVTNEDDGIVTSYVVIKNITSAQLGKSSSHIKITVICVGAAIIAVISLYTIYIYIKVIKPFDKMKKFAIQIAAGNLDFPLDMDNGNLFGAFTESFDIMREELALARQKEREANQSKKELVASLSHDIKTPVSSIKATTELLEITSSDEHTIYKLRAIDEKADQIEQLINNLFHATLEELNELSVNPAEESSQTITELIHLADYNNMIDYFTIPDCIVLFDRLRLGQIFDNIISNSYKYAGTKISVTSNIDGNYLMINIHDYGNTLEKDDVALCCNKFYRGKNSAGKSGSGLGLYITSYLCSKMGGELEISQDNGFTATVRLRLA